MAAGGATGGVLVWDSCCEPVAASEETAVGGPRPTADLRNNGHEYGIPVPHLAAYPDGSFFISADSTTLKVSSLVYVLRSLFYVAEARDTAELCVVTLSCIANQRHLFTRNHASAGAEPRCLSTTTVYVF